MGGAIVTELAAEILIPAAAAVGIAYALVQWILVARVRLSPESEAAPPQRGSGDGGVGGDKNGYEDFLIEGEEGINNREVVVKCAEIQSAISEGPRADLLPRLLVPAPAMAAAEEDDEAGSAAAALAPGAGQDGGRGGRRPGRSLRRERRCLG